MAGISNIYRRFRRPHRVRFKDLGPPRLELPSNELGRKASYGSMVERITRIFLSMDSHIRDKVLEEYRVRFGDGSFAYAKRTIARWEDTEVVQVGQVMMRLLEVVPLFVDLETKFELVEVLREETLRRVRFSRITMTVPADAVLHEPLERLLEIIDAQVATKLPPGVIDTKTWLTPYMAHAFDEMIAEGERLVLYAQAKEFFRQAQRLQRLSSEIAFKREIRTVFKLPTAQFTLRIVQARGNRMGEELLTTDDSGLLAKWSELELETRFKSGEVSYPEYVLRNMEKIFSKEEQNELHKIAAMHGLELERLLMEIQIKSRTSEADLQKLLTTLRTLQEKKITADVVSRHETPSGHIEISARSRKAVGCLPLGGVLLLIVLILVLIL